MIAEPIADVAIVIVGFRNSTDIKDCLQALSAASDEPRFEVLICENGGDYHFQQLIKELLGSGGPCQSDDAETIGFSGSSRLTKVRRLRLRTRSSNVWVGCAVDNLGYAGGINVWLEQLQSVAGWKGVWILNPDTQPHPHALAALVERAQTGNKGMVGSTILSADHPDKVYCRGGLYWQEFAARGVCIGLGEALDTPHDVSAIEAEMACLSGASMYVTRSCLEEIGPMDEGFFLFYEDADWGIRAKHCGLGYAGASIVAHKQGTTTGSARAAAHVPQLSVYLLHRNLVGFVRKHFPRTLPICIFVSLLYAIRFLLRGAPRNFRVALEGTWAGLKGETGRPANYS